MKVNRWSKYIRDNYDDYKLNHNKNNRYNPQFLSFWKYNKRFIKYLIRRGNAIGEK